MRPLFITGCFCFLAGLGLGVVLTELVGPEPAAPESAATPPAPPAPFSAPARNLPDSAFEAPESPPPPAAVEEAEQPEERRAWSRREPGEEGPPPWMNWMSSNRPPESVRTNREAMRAWMAERQQERAAALRSNFLAEAKLSEPEAVRFDVLMAALNMRLQEKAAQWRQAMDDGSMNRAEVRARAMSEISQAMVLTYDELDRNMPAGWRDEAGNDFNLMTFVDPVVMHDLRPLLRGGFRGGGPGGPGGPDGPGRPPER